MRHASQRLHHGEDGVVAIVVALSMVLFLSMLAVVIDLGQLQSVRVTLANAVDAATTTAAQILAQGGCSSFDTARSQAAAELELVSPGATIDTFEVTYGVIVVDDATDCLLVVTDEKVGRVDVEATATSAFAFADFFTDPQGSTNAAAGAQWGYVSALNGRVRPLTLCDQSPGYLDYLQYLADRELFEADVTGIVPPPDPDLLVYDTEIDAFDNSPCEDDPAAAEFGEFVLVDFGGDKAPSSKDLLREWVREGGEPIVLDDPSTASFEGFCTEGDPDNPGSCEGVTQAQSLDAVSDFEPVLGHAFTVMLHGRATCDNKDEPPNYNHCNGGKRGHRSYYLSGLVRVRMLCLRLSALDPLLSPVSQADGLPDGYCDDLPSAAVFPDVNPGDDVMVRLEFVLDSVIQSANLSTNDDFDHGFVGFNLCRVDADDNCGF